MRVLLFVPLLVSCVDTSPDRIKLTGSIAGAEITVEQAALATGLSGGFTLALERGDLTESAATVPEAPVFSLLEADTGGQIATLDALGDPPPPWTIAPDSRVSVRFTLAGENLLDDTAASHVCGGDLSIAALVDPSDADSFTVQSGRITPAGCP